MKIALFGHGAMGRLVEERARAEGHEIALVITSRDAPSGTALKLRDLLAAHYGERDISVASTRAGFIPGTHRVGFDSAADQIMLTHTARSREGFASGALVAARWIQGRRGVYEFAEVIEEMLKERMNKP